MAFTKFATFEDAQVLDVKGSPSRLRTASLDKVGDYNNYRTGDGYMYVRLRAISSRVNKNHDGWPSIELAGGHDIFDRYAKQSSRGFTVEAADGSKEYGFATFMGKPNFVDHNNSDPKRARGVVVDSKLRVLPIEKVAASGDDYWTSRDLDPEHRPPTEVELLIEIDAQQFPKYAKAVRSGDLDGFSMGCDVEMSKCSHCGHEATNPAEYCSHILMKGAHHDYKTADGRRISRRSYENCYGIKFFEISGVFDPADETALAREVRASVNNEGLQHTSIVENEWGYDQAPDPLRGGQEQNIEKRALEIANKAGVPYEQAIEMAQRELGDPGRSVPGEGNPEMPKQYDYMHTGIDSQGLPVGPRGQQPPRVDRPGEEPPPWINPSFYEDAQELLAQDPRKRPVMNDPHMSSVHIAENPLPQSFHTTAPESVDTLREDKICPVCGENMDGETCDACGYVEPPKGFDNPDLNKAEQIQNEIKQNDEAMVQQPGGNPEDVGNQGQPQGPGIGAQPGGQPKQPGSFMQTRNRVPTARVIGEMRWQPRIDPKLAVRINQTETPLKPAGTPATNEPSQETVTKNPQKPVTSAMRTAQELIQATQGDTMSTKTADGPTGPDAAADARVDVTGVGGVLDASNEEASKSNSNKGDDGQYAQTDVTGIGSTGVTDVEADKTESLSTAGEESDDSGFNKDKNIEAIPTKTYDDSDGTQQAFTDPVTNETLEGNQNKGSSTKVGYDSAPFYDQPGLSGGSANKGTEPVDPVGKAQDRVDVLDATTTPDNNSGPTKTWSGTDGNKIYRQQNPVTPEVSEQYHDGWTSHTVLAFKLADAEVDLDLLPKDKKYNRVEELMGQNDGEITAKLETLSRVKTAGLAKLAQARQAGVTRLPGAFGRRTAAPNPDWRPEGRAFERVTDSEHTASSEEMSEDVHDSAIFG